MKQKLLSFLLILSALSFAGCGVDANISDNTGGIVQLPEAVSGDTGGADPSAGADTLLDPEENDPAVDKNVPEDGASEDQTGTSAGSDDVRWGDDTSPEAGELDEDGTYNSAEEVALYLHLYDHLPDNYLTKSEARDLGWSGGSVEKYAPGCAIGGDRFGNREGLLPSASGRNYYECDIDTIGETSRGAKRIIFSNDGLIYYTEDHYESFTLLYGEE